MPNSPADAGGDTLLVMNQPPTARQSWWALAVAGAASAGFAAAAPFAGTPLRQLNAFFPSLDAIVFVTDFVTAILLFAQFSISRSRSLLALACGYLFTALIVVPHALTFANAFSVPGLLGASIQTGSWLFIFWHLGFAAALLAYAVVKERQPAKPDLSRSAAVWAIGWTAASMIILVCALTWLATAGVTLLPPIILDNTRISPIVVYPIWLAIGISAAAIVVLSFRRKRSQLDQWLMVVAWVLIGELAFSGLLPSVRFSLGFYAGRVFSLVTSSIVLILLLVETTRLYVQLGRTNAMLERERTNKLMTLEALAASIAHEVRQPLTGIATSGGAARRFLEQSPPDIERAQSALSRMMDAAQRANRVFDNLRALFGTGELAKDRVDVNRVVLDALRALDFECKRCGVVVQVALSPELPAVMAHKGQLQEVMTNLIHNAIDAMDLVDGHRLLKLSTGLHGATAVSIAVEDTGPGFNPETSGALFEAFVTTKPHGMGLGLAISRMIVERHDGQISAAAANPRGAVFQIILPAADPGPVQ